MAAQPVLRLFVEAEKEDIYQSGVGPGGARAMLQVYRKGQGTSVYSPPSRYLLR